MGSVKFSNFGSNFVFVLKIYLIEIHGESGMNATDLTPTFVGR